LIHCCCSARGRLKRCLSWSNCERTRGLVHEQITEGEHHRNHSGKQPEVYQLCSSSDWELSSHFAFTELCVGGCRDRKSRTLNTFIPCRIIKCKHADAKGRHRPWRIFKFRPYLIAVTGIGAFDREFECSLPTYAILCTWTAASMSGCCRVMMAEGQGWHWMNHQQGRQAPLCPAISAGTGISVTAHQVQHQQTRGRHQASLHLPTPISPFPPSPSAM